MVSTLRSSTLPNCLVATKEKQENDVEVWHTVDFFTYINALIHMALPEVESWQLVCVWRRESWDPLNTYSWVSICRNYLSNTKSDWFIFLDCECITIWDKAGSFKISLNSQCQGVHSFLPGTAPILDTYSQLQKRGALISRTVRRLLNWIVTWLENQSRFNTV